MPYACRDDHYKLRLDLDRAIVNGNELLDVTKKRHDAQITAKNLQIAGLEYEIKELRRQLDSSFGRQPGGAGATLAATGG